MPKYDYDCSVCRTTVEILHSIKETPFIKCAICRATMEKRLHGLPMKSQLSRDTPSTPINEVHVTETERPSPKSDSAFPSSAANLTTFAIHEDESREKNLNDQKIITPLKQEAPRLADDVDPNKLMVEIVQGLLMAHERLDRMEAALRQAVESASREHLNSFDKNLRDVDARFQQTTADAGKAVKALQETKADLIRSVQGSAEHHLDAFTRRVNDIDRMLLSNQSVADKNKDYLLRLIALLDTQTNVARLENAKQGENWKNLDSFLKGWQSRLDKANLENVSEARSNALTITERLKAVEMNLQGTTTQLANANRRLLIWLIGLSMASLLLLGGVFYKLLGTVIYKMFVH